MQQICPPSTCQPSSYASTREDLASCRAAGAPPPPRSSTPRESGSTMMPRAPGRSWVARSSAPMTGPGESSSFLWLWMERRRRSSSRRCALPRDVSYCPVGHSAKRTCGLTARALTAHSRIIGWEPRSSSWWFEFQAVTTNTTTTTTTRQLPRIQTIKGTGLAGPSAFVRWHHGAGAGEEKRGGRNKRLGAHKAPRLQIGLTPTLSEVAPRFCFACISFVLFLFSSQMLIEIE